MTAKTANPSRFRNMVVSLAEAGQRAVRPDVSKSFIGNISDCDLRCYRRGRRARRGRLRPGAGARRAAGAAARAGRRAGPGLAGRCRHAGAPDRGRRRKTRCSSWASRRGSCTPRSPAQLLETTGIDIGLWQEGIACASRPTRPRPPSSAPAAPGSGSRGTSCDWLDADEVRARWPWLGPTHGALWAPHEGALEPEKLVAALLADAQRLGATLVQDTVTGLEQRGDRVAGVVGRRGRYRRGRRGARGGRLVGRARGLPRPAGGRAGARPDGRAALARERTPRHHLRPRLLHRRARATRRSSARRWSTPGSVPR